MDQRRNRNGAKEIKMEQRRNRNGEWLRMKQGGTGTSYTFGGQLCREIVLCREVFLLSEVKHALILWESLFWFFGALERFLIKGPCMK